MSKSKNDWNPDVLKHLEKARRKADRSLVLIKRGDLRVVPAVPREAGAEEVIDAHVATVARRGTDRVGAGAGGDLFDEAEVGRELRRLRTQREAQRLLAAEERASTHADFPSGLVLTDLLALPDQDAQFRIAGLLPAGGRVVLAARMKSGKTTSVGNLVRSLADGNPLFGAFACGPVARESRVVVIDDEMSRETINRWLRDQGIQNTDAVAVVPLRGQVGAFDILDVDVRREWVELLRSLSTEVLVVDCLRPILDALGLDESHEAGQFLVALDALVAEARISELVLVHHMGHDGERSRGDSRLRDWPDAEWKLVRADVNDPHSPVFFSAFGRDVDVEEGEMSFDPASRHLTFNALSGTRAVVANSTKVRAAVEYVAAHPGATTGAIEGALGGDNKTARGAIEQAVGAQQLLRLDKGNGKHHYTPEQTDKYETDRRQYNARVQARRGT
jgi:hypothetical protein